MKKTLITLALTLASGSVFAQMDNSTMNHDNMDHGSMPMEHAQNDSMPMDHSNMDHSSMGGMVATFAVGMPANGAKPDKVVHVLLSDDMKITFKKK